MSPRKVLINNTLTIDSSNPNTIYAGADTGVFKSTDRGASWKKSGQLGVTVALALNKDNPNILYAGIAESGSCFHRDRRLFRSTDGGESWSDSISPPINGCDNIHSLVIDPADSDTLYLANYDDVNGDTWTPLIKSTNGGSSWIALFGPPFAALAIDPHNPNTLYAGTFDFAYYGYDGWDYRNGVLKSTDGGVHWSTTGLTSTGVRVLVLDPINPNTIYAATGIFYLNPDLSPNPNSSRGLFKSIDGGENWSEFNVGLTDLNVSALVIDPSGTHLHAATTTGVFDYQYVTPCGDPISPEIQSFDSTGGTGSVNVTAKNECSWTATSYVSWITITSGGDGNGDGTMSYSVARNRSTLPRSTVLSIAARSLRVNQAAAPVRISSTSVAGKRLFVFGENFDPGAVILLNGEEQKTANNDENPKTALIAGKAGKRIQTGDKLQVRNPNGSMSPEFLFVGG